MAVVASNICADTLGQLVRERLAPAAPQDFVTNVIRALMERFPEDEALELAVDNAATFYLAGHEPPPTRRPGHSILLSEQPELQDEAAAEAEAALACGADADLPDRLPLLRAILEELLRLYPPVPRFDREAVAADRLGEHEICPGDLVSIWPWIIHRHKQLWNDPDVFDPQRFAPECRSNATVFSTSHSAAVLAPASAHGWRWPRR